MSKKESSPKAECLIGQKFTACNGNFSPTKLSFRIGDRLKKLPLAVAPESNIFADAAYTYYGVEDAMKETESVRLLVQRKSNSKRRDEPYMAYLKEQMRKDIETTFSGIKAMFLRKLHAVTFKGFLMKIVLFIMAYALNKTS